jgi:flagellar hook-associated protein 2
VKHAAQEVTGVSSISSLNSTLLGGLSGNGALTPGLNNSGTPTITGIASGLDTNALIQDLTAIDQAQISSTQSQVSSLASQQNAFQKIGADLSTLRSDIASLAQSNNGVFDIRNATSSNPNLVTAAATSSAVPGVYGLTVNNLAAANEIASQGFASATAPITQGTFQISSGSNSATITIDSTNDTLQGLATAINNAGVGVTASIVNDGSGSGNQPFRLLLSANQTGTANAIQITNSLAADNNGAVLPAFNGTYIGAASTAAGYTGTAVPTSNSGAGAYTGTSNDTYTFTVVNSGTVGTDSIQLAYTDSSGANSGTITVGAANTPQNVAQGLQVALSAGNVVQGQSFTVKAYVPTVQQAANASVTVGSGSGALNIQSATNQIDGLIQGVTVNLLGAASNTPLTLTVGGDTEQASSAIQGFVSDFNTLMSDIDQDVSYDPQSGQAGLLLGNVDATNIQDQLRSLVGGVVSGANPKLNNLGALGITFDNSGQLQVNQTTLSNVLAGNVSGVSLDDVKALFALTGSSNTTGVSFAGGSDKAQASTNGPYQVNIRQAAQQASILASGQLGATTSITSANNTFGITVNGIASGTITIPPDDYSQAGLAQAVQNAINSQPALAANQVTVSVSGSQLSITTNNYGSAAQIAISSGTAIGSGGPLGFNGTETGTGTDVAGNFDVNGLIENATGQGQLLTGNSGNANTANLAVTVSLTAAQVGAGTTADLTVSRGLASQLTVALDGLLAPNTGQLANLNNGYQTTEDDLNQQITQMQTNLQTKQQALADQFTAMEQAVSQLQSISSFLQMQFNPTSQQQKL